MNTSEVRRILDELPRKSIAVVGDFFIDRYLHIDPALDEPSLETGLTAYQVTRVRDQAGAAGTVTANLEALGVGTLFAVAVVGEDGPGMLLRRDLAEKGVQLDFLLEDADRLTPTYTKPLRIRPDKPPEEVNRLDVRNRGQTPPEIEDRLI
ncbi:MAG: carbohydrate kinase, partial [Phycisphaerae bacterium]|nr:carbohydrate kinase [Phycisphaerae bacterium]